MSAFLWSLLAYVTLHCVKFLFAVGRDTYPRRLSLLLCGLGVWAA